MTYQFNGIGFELTRDCDQVCKDWCMRGLRQPNVRLTKDMVDAFFDDPMLNDPKSLVLIDNILLSGGEPALNEEIGAYIIDRIIDKMEKGNWNVGEITLVTNGQKFPRLLMGALIKYAKFQDSGFDRKFPIVHIKFSIDGRHKPMPPEVIGAYENIGIYLKDHTKDNSNVRIKSGLSTTGHDFVYDKSVGITRLGSRWCYSVFSWLYLSANGNINGDPDGSYKDMDADNWGNILQEPFGEILTQKIYKPRKRPKTPPFTSGGGQPERLAIR